MDALNLKGNAPLLAMTDGEGCVDLTVFFCLTLIQFLKCFARIVRGQRARGRRRRIHFDVVNFSIVNFAAICLRIILLTRNRGLCWPYPPDQRLFRDVLALSCCDRPRWNGRR